MLQHPSGTVTFLFTEIEGSTQLWEQHPAAMRAAIPQHDAILKDAVEKHAGYVVKTTGVGLMAAFGVADNSLRAALESQLVDAAETVVDLRIAAKRVRLQGLREEESLVNQDLQSMTQDRDSLIDALLDQKAP